MPHERPPTSPPPTSPPPAGTKPALAIADPTLFIGETLTVTGTGFQPGESVTATVYSEPVGLGAKQADATGKVVFTWQVAAGTAIGQHRVELVGALSGKVDGAFTVEAVGKTGNLPGAGGDVPSSTLAIALGLLAVGLVATGTSLIRRNRMYQLN
jgi:hypothetical protein